MCEKSILETLIVTFMTSALLAIFVILFGLWGDTTVRILLSTIAIFGFSIPGLACSVNYEKNINKSVAVMGMITCAISCLYLLMIIWGFFEIDFSYNLMWELLFSGVLFSSSFGHICLLLLVNSDNDIVNYFKYGTMCLSIFMDFLLLMEIYEVGDVSWRFVLVIIILVVLGTIVTPLLNKLYSKTDFEIVQGKTKTKNKVKPKNSLSEDKYDKLEKVKKLLDDGAITKEEYDMEKTKILNS